MFVFGEHDSVYQPCEQLQFRAQRLHVLFCCCNGHAQDLDFFPANGDIPGLKTINVHRTRTNVQIPRMCVKCFRTNVWVHDARYPKKRPHVPNTEPRTRTPNNPNYVHCQPCSIRVAFVNFVCHACHAACMFVCELFEDLLGPYCLKEFCFQFCFPFPIIELE